MNDTPILPPSVKSVLRLLEMLGTWLRQVLDALFQQMVAAFQPPLWQRQIEDILNASS